MIQRLPKPAVMFTGLALVALLVLICWSRADQAADSSQAQPAKNPPVLVTTARALSQNVALYVSGVGTVEANASVTIKAQVDGQLVKVGFAEGQDVKAGQVLAQIDPRPLQAQLEQYQAQKAKDQAQLENAQLDLQRYTTLAQQNSIAHQTLDTQHALVSQLAAALKTDQAQIDYARVQLGFTTIRAPLSGRVGARLVDPGNIVHATDTSGLVVINQVDPIAVSFTLPEQSFQAVNSAQQNTRHPLTVEAYDHSSGQVLARGQLSMVNNQIDTGSGTLQLKARFSNGKHQLWPGQYIDMRLILGTSIGAISVPDAAILRGANGTYVYLVGADQHVRSQPVKVNRIQDGIAVIDAGLQAGARVVVDGQYKLKPGSPIIEAAPGKGAVQ